MINFISEIPDWIKIAILVLGYLLYSTWWLSDLANTVERNHELSLETKLLLQGHAEASKIYRTQIAELQTKVLSLEQQTREQWTSIRGLNNSTIKCDSLLSDVLKHINITMEK